LEIEGFLQAQILEPSEEDTEYIPASNTTYLSIRYLVQDMDNLNKYLSEYAADFRKEGIEKWGTKVSYKRHIYKMKALLAKQNMTSLSSI
jgi:hypothetical protein